MAILTEIEATISSAQKQQLEFGPSRLGARQDIEPPVESFDVVREAELSRIFTTVRSQEKRNDHGRRQKPPGGLLNTKKS